MGFVSLSEDIQKRHESDVQELVRALELGAVPMVQQQHAMPQFQDLVEKLGKLLLDPNQPFAMRLMHMRAQERDQMVHIQDLSSKNAVLGYNNNSLNERIRVLTKENASLQNQISKHREEIKLLVIQKSEIANTNNNLIDSLKQCKAEISSLEKIAMNSQITKQLR